MINLNGIDQEVLKRAYFDREFEINGRTYKKLNVTHGQALEIMGLAQQIEAGKIVIGDHGWMQLENKLKKLFTEDDFILEKKKEHFDDYPEDYFTFIAYAIGVIVYPFTAGKNIA